MTQEYLIDSMYIFFFGIIGFAAAFAPFILSHLLTPRYTKFEKTVQIYECGMDPFCKAYDIRFGIAYYLYGLIFLAFDVDILYLFPVATAFNKVSSVRGIVELVIFIFILSLAVVYPWVKGVFRWEKRRKV
ncbi:MAG: NADH-quinone oxidoreductase subunit A [Desulfobacterales bacterium]|nr:NADH-quinone oxidoreductase subunit A [Desulfobacterales bacterium]